MRAKQQISEIKTERETTIECETELETLEMCLSEGRCPTRCPENCIVEPDGICPHNFKSLALEFDLI